MFKVLILASGKSYHATRWANYLAGKLHIGFATVHNIERPLSSSVDVFRLNDMGAPGYLLQAINLRRVISSWKPDLLHIHFATGYGLLGKLSGFSDRIVSLYGTDIYNFPRKSKIHKAILSFNLSGARAVLSTSECMADEFKKFFPECSRPLVTPFGVDLKKFTPAFKVNYGQNSLNIGIVKKLESKYGIDILINAFHILRTLLPMQEVRLHIVGAGSKEWELKKLCAAYNIEDSTCFYGAIPNECVPNFLKKMDIFVVPSRSDSESFGVAAVEAQACGLPVVVSDVGGLPEVVAHGETGLVVPRDNPSELANALRILCESPGYRSKLGSSARQRVEHFYNLEKNVGQMIDIYYKVMGNN